MWKRENEINNTKRKRESKTTIIMWKRENKINNNKWKRETNKIITIIISGKGRTTK